MTGGQEVPGSNPGSPTQEVAQSNRVGESGERAIGDLDRVHLGLEASQFAILGEEVERLVGYLSAAERNATTSRIALLVDHSGPA